MSPVNCNEAGRCTGFSVKDDLNSDQRFQLMLTGKTDPLPGMLCLSTLSHNHPARSAPLKDIDGGYCHDDEPGKFKPVGHYKIGTACFNDLSESWTSKSKWYARKWEG